MNPRRAAPSGAAARRVLWTLLVKKLWVSVFALTTGCLPFVVPPGKVAVGAGPARGEVLRDGGRLRPRSVTNLRAGIHPLDLVPSAALGRFDAGIGYGGDLLFGDAPNRYDRRTQAHGPYLEAAYFPLRVPAGSAVFRWGARGNLDLLYLEPHDVTGFGGTLVTELEITGRAEGLFANADSHGHGGVFGTSFGQWSLGAFVGGTARSFPTAEYQGITAGLSARIPFLAGIVCCSLSFASSDADDEPTRVTQSQPRHRTRPATPVRSSAPPERIPTPRRDELERKP